jgi:hypothetical protein
VPDAWLDVSRARYADWLSARVAGRAPWRDAAVAALADVTTASPDPETRAGGRPGDDRGAARSRRPDWLRSGDWLRTGGRATAAGGGDA